MDLPQWSLRGKIVLLGVLLPTILVIIFMRLYSSEAREKTIAAFAPRPKPSALPPNPPATRWRSSGPLACSAPPRSANWPTRAARDKVLATVPVFSAWQAAMRKAEESGYTFKVPKFSSRNAKNEPDALESKALKYMAANQVDEYHEVDTALNAVRYFRAIRLTETCLLCHGDPRTSQALWGNGKGIDPTGGPMENWQVGEIHGAFEVIQSLDEADRQLAASLNKATQIALIGLVIMAIFFATLLIGIVSNSVIKPIKRIINELTANSNNLLDAANMVATASSQLADGANQQAASVEETSASLEETSSMIRLHAENVNRPA